MNVQHRNEPRPHYEMLASYPGSPAFIQLQRLNEGKTNDKTIRNTLKSGSPSLCASSEAWERGYESEYCDIIHHKQVMVTVRVVVLVLNAALVESSFTSAGSFTDNW